MPISAAERRFILNQLGEQAADTVSRLWDAANRFEDVDFFNFIADSFPEIAIGYHQIAAEYAAAWFEYDFPDLRAVAAAPPSVESLKSSAEWALGADGRKALDRMNGTMQRTIYNGDRDTTAASAEIMGMRWVRIARPNACAFCRLLASRAAADVNESLYRSEEAALRVVGRSVNLSIGDRRAIASGQMTRDEALYRRDQMQLTYQIGRRKGTARGRRQRGSRSLGEKYHDDCYCTAKAIPAGRNTLEYLYQTEPEAAASAEQYLNEYIKAAGAADSGDPKAILSQWRQLSDDIA